MEPVQNISGVSIVTPRERNDSTFLREKCRPGIFLPGASLSREKAAEDVEQKLEERRRRPNREVPTMPGESENERTDRDPRSSASHVATVAMYSRSLARAYICIYSDWRIVGKNERGRKMKRRETR